MKRGALFFYCILLTAYCLLLTGEAHAWQWPWEKYKAQQMELKAVNERYVEAIQKNLALREELETLNEKYKAQEVERNNILIRIKELEKEKENLIKAYQEVKGRPVALPKLDARTKELSKKLDEITKDRDKIQKRLDEASKRLANVDKRILEEVQKKVEQVRTERTAVFKALQDEKVKLQDETRNVKITFEKEKKELGEKINELEGSVKVSSVKCQSLEKELKGARSALQAKEEELKAGKQKFDAEKKRLEASLKDTLIKSQKLDEKLKNTESGLQKSTASIQKSAAENKKLNAEREKLLADIRELEVDKAGLKNEAGLAMHAQKKAERDRELAEKKPKELKAQTNKERLDMHYNLAVVYDKNGMYKDAEREYLKCLAIKPDDAGVHYNLGILYNDKLNNNALAAEHYKKFLELRPMGEDAEQVKQWMFHIEQEQRIGVEVR